MKEHKSNLKALEPVEIRLAAAVRIRHEIARLTRVEQALDNDAREIALSVVGRPEALDIVLGVIGAAFADDTDAYDQAAVEAFLAEHHDLRIGASATGSPPGPQGASTLQAGASAAAAPTAPPAGGAVAAPNAPAAPVVQPPETPSAQHDAVPSAAEAVAARLSFYEVDMPADYFGVSFDMLKRPEADLIMGEAILAVVDGLPLDASPYKGDRGKVHWRRKLFEETYAFFLAAPPRAKDLATHAVESVAVEDDVVDTPVIETPPADLAEVEAGTPQIQVQTPQVQAPQMQDPAEAGQPSADPVRQTGQPDSAPEPADADLAPEPAPTAEAHVPDRDAASSHASPDDEADRGGDEHVPVEDGEGADDERPSGDDVREDAAELPLIEPVREHAGSGRVIDFPSPTTAPAAAAQPDHDHVDPFESSPPHRRTASLAAVGSAEDGDRTETPTYDGPAWEAPGSEDDLERNFADRAGFDRDDDDRYGAPVANPGFDHAAAAALARAVEVPGAETTEASRLPVGGVPPRPAIAMPSARPVPAAPPRPAPASPGPVASSLPPTRPAIAGAGDGVRLAPRPVAVRPPGM